MVSRIGSKGVDVGGGAGVLVAAAVALAVAGWVGAAEARWVGAGVRVAKTTGDGPRLGPGSAA
jgi:hypothetical protein